MAGENRQRRTRDGLRALIVALLLSTTLPVLADSALTVESLGLKIFFDPSLSASGQMSCASCHDPAHAHAQANALGVQSGGAHIDVPGFRSVPSLRYMTPDAFFFDA